MAETQQLSQAAFDRLSAEHRDLTTRGRIDIARKIEAARELGDLSENADYHAAKEEQGRMEGRIMHLVRIIENAEIVGETTRSGDRVHAGDVVSVLFDGDDEPERYLIGSIEEKSPDVTVVSSGSPMGQALLDAKLDDAVTWPTPSGATLKATVVAIG